MSLRIPFGLERLPRTTSADDPRLPGVVVDAEKLRLNTEPLPPTVVALGAGDHAARVAAVVRWLSGQCGDYAPQRQRFIEAYIRCIAEHLRAHHDEVVVGLRRYDGLYAPQDWLWSALRPLPRAWLTAKGRLLPCDIAFWDGTQVSAIELAAQETDRAAALRAAGIAVCRIGLDTLAEDVLAVLPVGFRWFWREQTLPSSPFRRPIPAHHNSPA
jgi:hypothetical protein